MRGFELVSDQHRKHPGCNILIPQRGTAKSAGYDLCTPVDIVIPARGQSGVIFTDIKAYMEADEVLTTHVRSSIGTTGIIDSDYYSNPDNDGNIGFMLRNLTDEEVIIKTGERVIQGIFIKYLISDHDQPKSEERLGGVGSTGKK